MLSGRQEGHEVPLSVREVQRSAPPALLQGKDSIHIYFELFLTFSKHLFESTCNSLAVF